MVWSVFVRLVFGVGIEGLIFGIELVLWLSPRRYSPIIQSSKCAFVVFVEVDSVLVYELIGNKDVDSPLTIAYIKVSDLWLSKALCACHILS